MFEDEQDISFIRLHALVRRGYRAQLGNTTTPEAIWLNHPGKGPELILYPAGHVVAPGLRGSQSLRIESDDVAGFERFVREVQVPTLWQRTADARIKIVVCAVLLGFFVLCGYLGGLLVDWVRGLVGL